MKIVPFLIILIYYFVHIVYLRGEDYFEPEYVHFMNGWLDKLL